MLEGEKQQTPLLTCLSIINLSLSLKATLVKINGQPLLYVNL